MKLLRRPYCISTLNLRTNLRENDAHDNRLKHTIQQPGKHQRKRNRQRTKGNPHGRNGSDKPVHQAHFNTAPPEWAVKEAFKTPPKPGKCKTEYERMHKIEHTFHTVEVKNGIVILFCHIREEHNRKIKRSIAHKQQHNASNNAFKQEYFHDSNLNDDADGSFMVVNGAFLLNWFDRKNKIKFENNFIIYFDHAE